jgi:hypothetical protein
MIDDESDSSKTMAEVSDSSSHSPENKRKTNLVLRITIGSGSDDAPEEESLVRLAEELAATLCRVKTV